jgi:hypothetical protein
MEPFWRQWSVSGHDLVVLDPFENLGVEVGKGPQWELVTTHSRDAVFMQAGNLLRTASPVA